MTDPLDIALAVDVLHAYRYHSRRGAKAAMRQVTPNGKPRHTTAAELDGLLARIAADPRLEEIERLVMERHLKQAATDRERRPGT